MYKNAAHFLGITLLLFLFVVPVYAQDLSNGTAIGIKISEKVQDGDIITSAPPGYKLTTSAYDPQIFGVVSLNPAVYFKNVTDKSEIPVISTGEVLVRVSSRNGNIQVGDFITSSAAPGVGEKVNDNGYVLGRAQESYASSNPNATGLILVTMQPHFAQITDNIVHNIFSSFTFGLNEAVNTPLGAIRYFVAGAITLISFYLGFRFFARASNRGVEAIGRNPLAKQAILFSVFINTIITVTIMFFGVAISYLILVL
jgi:F0F1-type ATP synthase membrane subunit c/vacuolar-type H+-ATPase subunit K